MREILFRGKRKNGTEWVYGNYCGAEYLSSSGIEHLIIEIPRNGCSAQVDPETIGQYTGLTANGKKIFEGDIVKREFTLYHSEKKKTRETQIGVVTYSDTDCGFYLEKACNLRKPWDGDTLEVIGNIHDNPELLKGGETDV